MTMYVLLCTKDHHYLKVITKNTPIIVKNNNLFKVAQKVKKNGYNKKDECISQNV